MYWFPRRVDYGLSLVMHFIVIFGPPAVGKMSVGDEITKLTGIPVFHNHLSIEPVLRFFPFGSKEFHHLVDSFRINLLHQIADSDLPGVIFTFVWSMKQEEDAEFLREICDIFEAVGADIAFVELTATIEERLSRNKTEKRLLEKPSKRNVEFSERLLLQHEDEHQMNSDGSIPLEYRHIMIDNSQLEPATVAMKIVETLSIKKRH